MTKPNILLSFLFVTLFLFTAPQTSIARTAEEWRDRTIYQLLTDRFAQTPGQENPQLCSDNSNTCEIRHYCGGSFLGIISKLDYIKNMGFDAIWISPVVKQMDGDTIYGVGWHGYWAQDLYMINPHFGTADDLKNLVKAAHSKDIWVMVDVVGNHMGPQQGLSIRNGNDYVKVYNPFNKTEHYHVYCTINPDYRDQGNVEYCSIGAPDLPLPDLDTENPVVVAELYKWISWLINEFNFDGIRIDTARHIRHDFWDGFTRSSGVFSIGEIPDGNAYFVGSYQGHMDSTLGFPLYSKIRDLYTGANMYGMKDIINDNRKAFNDTRLLGNFIDCHDQERFNHRTQDKVLVRNALTFILTMDGIPIVYQGTEHDFTGNPGGGDPYNREALWPSSYSQQSPSYQFIAKINAFRKVLPRSFYTSLSIEAWIDDHIYAFSKDKALIITSNYGRNNPNRDLVIQGNGRWPVGDILINVINCDERIVIDGSSNVPVKINGEPKILYPRSSLVGTRICGL